MPEALAFNLNFLHPLAMWVLLALTGYGVYTAFGAPSKALSDPFDDHDD